MGTKSRESVKELLAKFKSGYYIEYEFYSSLARRACTDGWDEVLTDLPPEELMKFKAWVRNSFLGPGVKMYPLGNAADTPPYSAEQEEFLFRWGHEDTEDDKVSENK